MRPTGSVEWNRRDVARVVAFDGTCDLTAHRHRRSERATVAGQDPFEHTVGAHEAEPAVGARDDETVVVDPGVTTAHPELGRHHDGRSGRVGSMTDPGPTTRSERPS